MKRTSASRQDTALIVQINLVPVFANNNEHFEAVALAA
jgi:hypothetical protein|tara:strand:+ start:1535 stop:1648 length:114 start_codon:yes stop_codon:yes gene_type:complete